MCLDCTDTESPVLSKPAQLRHGTVTLSGGSVVPQSKLPASVEVRCSLMPTQAPVTHPHLVLGLWCISSWRPCASTPTAFSNLWGRSCNWEKINGEETQTTSSPLETGRKPRWEFLLFMSLCTRSVTTLAEDVGLFILQSSSQGFSERWQTLQILNSHCAPAVATCSAGKRLISSF